MPFLTVFFSFKCLFWMPFFLFFYAFFLLNTFFQIIIKQLEEKVLNVQESTHLVSKVEKKINEVHGTIAKKYNKNLLQLFLRISAITKS